MSSREDTGERRRKSIVNETGRKLKEFDPEDIEKTRENVQKEEAERMKASGRRR